MSRTMSGEGPHGSFHHVKMRAKDSAYTGHRSSGLSWMVTSVSLSKQATKRGVASRSDWKASERLGLVFLESLGMHSSTAFDHASVGARCVSTKRSSPIASASVLTRGAVKPQKPS